MKRLLIAIVFCLIPIVVFGQQSLPWETTYNCDEWTSYNDPLNCDGLEKNGNDVVCTNKQEEIITAANYSAGGGGRGQRHYIEDGDNVQSGGTFLNIANTPSGGEVWVRYYFRYELGFAWECGNFDGEKQVYINPGFSSGAGYYIPQFRDFDQLRVNFNGNTQASVNWGWDDLMVNGPDICSGAHKASDGQWHSFEFYMKQGFSSTGASKIWVDGVLRLDATNIDVPILDTMVIGSNQKTPDNNPCSYIDYDDFKISTTGYIGPISPTGPPPNITGVELR